MMHLDIARALDATLLASDCGLEPDAWQADLLRDMPKRALLLCSRQSGKSTVTALIALWTAIYEAPAMVILVSPSQRQSGELFRTVVGFHSKLVGAPEMVTESVLRCELANGSRIIALPGTERTVRGYAAASLVVIDEAARVEDELLAAVRPMMATKAEGRLLALTTPAGKRGWFFDAWHGDGDWTRIRVPASECPRISKAFLAEELKRFSPAGERRHARFHNDDATNAAVTNALFARLSRTSTSELLDHLRDAVDSGNLAQSEAIRLEFTARSDASPIKEEFTALFGKLAHPTADEAKQQIDRISGLRAMADARTIELSRGRSDPLARLSAARSAA